MATGDTELDCVEEAALGLYEPSVGAINPATIGLALASASVCTCRFRGLERMVSGAEDLPGAGAFTAGFCTVPCEALRSEGSTFSSPPLIG